MKKKAKKPRREGEKCAGRRWRIYCGITDIAYTAYSYVVVRRLSIVFQVRVVKGIKSEKKRTKNGKTKRKSNFVFEDGTD